MSRCTRFLGALVLAACAEKPVFDAPAASEGCARPDTGCACEPGSAPIACFEPDQLAADGEVICHEGTRHCEAGRWSACRDVHGYRASTRPNVGAIVNPNATPKSCSICDLQCFEVTDPLLAVDAGADSSVSYAGSGGLTIAEGDGGTTPTTSGPTLTGCAGLTQCCDQLQAVPALRAACMSANTGVAAQCDDAHRLFCSDVVLGTGAPCVAGSDPNDLDCDHIPDLVDRCLPSNYATDLFCGGSTMPLPGNPNPAIFHVLDIGRSASDPLYIEYKVRNADVYFLLDTSDTMSEERTALTDSLTMNNVAECALLKNCCDTITNATTKSQCMTYVKSTSSTAQTTCKTRQATYCTSTVYTDCADTDADGLPNNELKDEGVAGAIRCLVGTAHFGAGEFRELPFGDGCSYGFDGYDQSGSIEDRGDHDEWAFRHHVDMTEDIDRVRRSLEQFRTSGNYEYPEASMVALYSVLTGNGATFGQSSPNVAARAGDTQAGCLSGTFGYPCFRGNSVPIVMLFTDDPMSNGPAGFNPGFQETDDVYASSYAANGRTPTSGAAKYVPESSQQLNVLQSRSIGDVYQRFEFASGTTRDMGADLTGAQTGCGAADDAPDAVFRFRMTGSETAAVRLNVAVEPPANYQDVYTGIVNGPTPTTDFPAVLSLYDSTGTFIKCATVCPNVAPFNCKATGASCSSDSDCCSGDCQAFTNKCRGAALPGSDPCTGTELTSDGFTHAFTPGNYYVSVKGRRATEQGFYEVQVGNVARGGTTAYRPPSWSMVSNAIDTSGVRILPVLSCDDGGLWGDQRCPGTRAQASVLAEDSGAVDSAGNPLIAWIKPDGTGLSSNVVLSVRDLSKQLTMDVTLQTTFNPGFDVNIQKCTNLADPAQAACTMLSVGCVDVPPGPKDTVRNCKPGAIPRFVVTITNPTSPPVPPLPAAVDPFGGHLFALQLLGNHQALLDEIPVYIIPTDRDAFGPPAAPFQSSGSYTQPVYAKGCLYNALEGESPVPSSCIDQLDNDMDGLKDNDDPDCQLGSCLDGKDNDGDGVKDIEDGSCEVTAQQEWTDLFLNADVPFGTSIVLEACAANSQAELDSCSYSTVATVRSLNQSCSTNAHCSDIDLGAGAIDGYCSNGQCQYLDPPKRGATCTTDAQCQNGTINGKLIESHCDSSAGRCVYVSQPADLGGALAAGERGLPYLQLKITLNANTAMTAAPTLFDWNAQYVCRSNR